MTEKLTPRDWSHLLTDSFFVKRAKTRFNTISDLHMAREFQAFQKLVRHRGRTLLENENRRISVLSPSDFSSIDERLGLALFGNECFDRGLGIDGTSVADNPVGQLKFLETDDQLVSLVGEKIIDDPYGRRIYYLDLAGTLKIQRGSGLGALLGREALQSEIQSSDKDIVFLSRTQNPMLVALARKILPAGIKLSPFWADAADPVIQSANWTVESGFMSRNNNRQDSRFDANESLIFWGSYGEKGDGSSWEDMTKQLSDLDWNREEGQMMQRYLVQFGSSWNMAKVKGHSFVLGAFIPVQ
jgi:hypothetical protein